MITTSTHLRNILGRVNNSSKKTRPDPEKVLNKLIDDLVNPHYFTSATTDKDKKLIIDQIESHGKTTYQFIQNGSEVSITELEIDGVYYWLVHNDFIYKGHAGVVLYSK